MTNGKSPFTRGHEAKQPIGGGAVVLVVEDDQGVRRIIGRILRASGYLVLEAGGPTEARDLCSSTRQVDLILADVMMPQTTGPELVQELMRAQPAARALFMSGHSRDAVIREGLLDARANYLAKPFMPAALISQVQQALVGEPVSGRKRR